MWEFICKWLPVLAFLTGTLLGWIINSLFEKVRRQYFEKLYKDASDTNVALESQLTSKNILENDLSRTNTEIEKLRKDIRLITESSKQDESVNLENIQLRGQVKKLKKKASSEKYIPKKDFVNDYQIFLSELEKNIKKAKKKSFQAIDSDKEDSPKKKKKKSKSKSKSKKKGGSKYDFYKEKFANKKLSGILPEITEVEKDLTYLYGVTKNIQKILNENGIKTFSDLSNTKIKELKTILALAGKKYESINPLNWPIQARIAEKGQWEILDEYKSKMEM